MQKLQMVARALPILRREAITELLRHIVSPQRTSVPLPAGRGAVCLTQNHPHTRLISARLFIGNLTTDQRFIDLQDAHNLQTIRNAASGLDYAHSPSGITTIGRDHRLAWIAPCTLNLNYTTLEGTPFQDPTVVHFEVDTHDLYEGLSRDDELTGYLGSQRGAGAGTPA